MADASSLGPLEESYPDWRAFAEAVPDGLLVMDPQFVIRGTNSRLEHMADQPGGLAGLTLGRLFNADVRAQYGQFLLDFFAAPVGHGLVSVDDVSLRRGDGTEIAIDVTLAPISVGAEVWAIATVRDVTDEHEAAARHLEMEQRFQLAFENSVAPIIFTDLEDRIVAANDAFCQMVGYSRAELIGHDSTLFTSPEDVGITEAAHRRLHSGAVGSARYVKHYRHRDGRTLLVEVSRAPARDEAGNILYHVISERDITEERALTNQLSYQALHDPLTGLANRALIEDRLERARARVLRGSGFAAVLLFDLDDFKSVNDAHGHLVGDQLLIDVAQRLERVTRTTDTLCRFGGDEFLYLAEGLNQPEDAQVVAARLLGELVEPFVIAGAHIVQHASVGVVVWGAESPDRDQVVEQADVALYEAKRRGKNRFAVYNPEMYDRALQHVNMAQELRRALQFGEISMHYQPVVDTATSEVVGFEALMRWQHPERGWVPPLDFLPQAESSGVIVELGAFTLREAVLAASAWEPGASGHRPYVSVNVSAQQFRDPGLVALVDAALEESHLDPARLVIEVPERVALSDVVGAVRTMDALSQRGVGVALDNFGAGFASLSYLMRLRPRYIKIDQAFARPAVDALYSDALLESIVNLGNKLDLTILAEGIETSEQLGRLRRFGCEITQGFLFSPAVPASDVTSMLAELRGVVESVEDAATSGTE